MVLSTWIVAQVKRIWSPDGRTPWDIVKTLIAGGLFQSQPALLCRRCEAGSQLAKWHAQQSGEIFRAMCAANSAVNFANDHVQCPMQLALSCPTDGSYREPDY